MIHEMSEASLGRAVGFGRNASANYVERVRAEIADTAFSIGEQRVTVTVSAGVSSLKKGVDSVADLLKRADVALYEAKSGGRNRVVAKAA